jgi:NTE family protein
MGAVPKKVAIILPGAVAKGAFAAGVLKVLAQQKLEVTRIVATSSGALNAVLYASYVRRGRERDGTAELVRIWTERAGARSVFSLDVASVLRLEGMFASKIRGLLQGEIKAGAIPSPRPISLRLLVAPLRGVDSRHLDAIAHADDPDPRPLTKNRTTYEYVCDFDQDDFIDEADRDCVINAALASSAFPFVFVPVDVELEVAKLGRRVQLGPCIDGGAVNNAPIKWAMGGEIGKQLDAVLVIAPTPEREERPHDVRGVKLIDQVASMLVNERMYRDLRESERVNTQLAALEKLGLSGDDLAKVKDALGLKGMKHIGVVEIRPRAPLPGNGFSAFFSRSLREQYIEAGEKSAWAAFEDPENRWLLSDEPPGKLRAVP